MSKVKKNVERRIRYLHGISRFLRFFFFFVCGEHSETVELQNMHLSIFFSANTEHVLLRMSMCDITHKESR